VHEIFLLVVVFLLLLLHFLLLLKLLLLTLYSPGLMPLLRWLPLLLRNPTEVENEREQSVAGKFQGRSQRS
jgi:hypothetical protein